MSFKANWICRAGKAAVMVPKPALVMSVVGGPKFVWFRRLKNSERNCKAMPSRAGIRKFLFTPISHCQKLGPRNAFRPTLPNGADAGGMANAALLKYCLIIDASLARVGSATRFGRWVATPRHSASRPVASFALVGV